MSQTYHARTKSELPQVVGADSHLSPAIQSRASPEPDTTVELAFLAKDSLRNVPDELKGLSVLSSEGKYFVVGPPDVAPAYGDHSVPLEVVIARHKRRRTSLSPHPCFIHRLPTEVLCAIFLMCGDHNKLFDYPRDERLDTASIHLEVPFYIRSAVAIRSVCWRWFTIARGCPMLWTMIDIPLPQPRDVAALQLSLEHSNGLPLTLRINDFHYSSRRNVRACQAFMALVAASASRWEEISIILYNTPPTVHDMVSPLLELPRDAFTFLRRALLLFEEDDSQTLGASRLWQMFYTSPALRVAQWYFRLPINAPPETLRRLTHVGFNVIRPEAIMGVIHACPQLQVLQAIVQPETLIWSGQDDGYMIQCPSTPIHLAHLHTVMLRGMHNWTNFFEGITAPNLRRLEFHIAGVQAGVVCAMLARSSACLDMIALRWLAPGFDDEVIALLQAPRLKDLKILCHEPYRGWEREPDHFDPSPYLPSNLVTFTQSYEAAESMYRSLLKH
ncbi:hypothetical protein K525DRAFT_270088 [Schizophyllum commune Loenen D]|nr:hypothetical protein K525DRAFT_270088 [Schizophyllum commune Loenen D]